MRVQIRRIGPEGLGLEETFPVDIIADAQTDTFRFIRPLEAKAKVIGVEDEILATITVNSCYASFCSRCLEEIEQDWTANFILSFNAKECADSIEMDDDIRQELILGLPVRILCEKDCKGLCVDCGVNLNKQQCEHQHVVPSDQ